MYTNTALQLTGVLKDLYPSYVVSMYGTLWAELKPVAFNIMLPIGFVVMIFGFLIRIKDNSTENPLKNFKHCVLAFTIVVGIYYCINQEIIMKGTIIISEALNDDSNRTSIFKLLENAYFVMTSLPQPQFIYGWTDAINGAGVFSSSGVMSLALIIWCYLVWAIGIIFIALGYLAVIIIGSIHMLLIVLATIFAPLMLPFIMVPQLANKGVNFVVNASAIMLWAVGISIGVKIAYMCLEGAAKAGLITGYLSGIQTSPNDWLLSFQSAKFLPANFVKVTVPALQATGITPISLVALCALLGVLVIFFYIMSPIIITKMINGVSPAEAAMGAVSVGSAGVGMTTLGAGVAVSSVPAGGGIVSTAKNLRQNFDNTK